MRRIQDLIERLEAGQRLSVDDIDRAAQLQALDVARFGELASEQHQQAETQANEQLQQIIDPGG